MKTNLADSLINTLTNEPQTFPWPAGYRQGRIIRGARPTGRTVAQFPGHDLAGASSRRLLLGFLVCALILVACVPSAVADECAKYDKNKKLAALLTDLDDDDFDTRECASRVLETRLPTLGKADLEKIVVAYAKGSVEVQRRTGQLIAAEVIGKLGVADAEKAAGHIEVKISTEKAAKGQVKFEFGRFKGTTTTANFAELLRIWIAYRNFMQAGNTASADQETSNLADFVDNEFANLNLTLNGKQASKFAAQIDIVTAGFYTRMAEEEIKKKIAPPKGNNPQSVNVPSSGPVNLGLTVGMNIQQVLTPGTLSDSWTNKEFAYGPPPAGFVSFGPMYDIQVDQDLMVSGAISFSIQYGGSDGNAYGIVDPSQLAIVRIANGQYQVLNCLNDLGTHTITGVYSAEVLSQYPDQFGEFMLVGPSSSGAADITFVQAGPQQVMVYGDDFSLPAGLQASGTTGLE